MPTKRTVDNIKSKLLQPALTSHFEVQIPVAENLVKNVLQPTGINIKGNNQETLNLLCAEASLPGSSLATLEINNDYTGVTERHAHRRIYDDRIDLTFYVDANSYLPIIFFESWIKYIVGESQTEDQKMRGKVTSNDPTYFYRVRYPNNYIAEGLTITKFERNYNSSLQYKFIRAYPISITSMPISYNSSDLLKCTVSMTYIRYVITGAPYSPNEPKSIVSDAPSTPTKQANINGVNFGTAMSLDNLVDSYGFSGGTGGNPLSAVSKSGKTIQVQQFNTDKMTKTFNGGSGLG